jgi:acetate kinase
VEKIISILAINSGSSSLKFKLFSDTHPLRILAGGHVSGIGSARSSCTITNSEGKVFSYPELSVQTSSEAAIPILEWLQQQDQYDVKGIGHRIVHGGMKYSAPVIINEQVLLELKKMKAMAPSHNEAALSVIRTFRKAFPSLTQVACFDTWFHHKMPFEAKQYALPESLRKEGVIRYGFHGLSCEYIMDQLQQMYSLTDNSKIIIAHLGNGCSITAVKGKESIDTTMGFTPASGMIMSTRAGDIDPGIFTYLLGNGMKADELVTLFNKESGLKAISGTTHDMSQLLQTEHTDTRSRQAITIFCYYAKKQIGALAAALGGLDILVFTGGIGENQSRIRMRICNDLDFLGIRVNDVLNRQAFANISASNSAANICVIKTNEELMIARHTQHCLQSTPADQTKKSYDSTDAGKSTADRSLLAGSQLPGRRSNLFTKESPAQEDASS